MLAYLRCNYNNFFLNNEYKGTKNVPCRLKIKFKTRLAGL